MVRVMKNYACKIGEFRFPEKWIHTEDAPKQIQLHQKVSMLVSNSFHICIEENEKEKSYVIVVTIDKAKDQHHHTIRTETSAFADQAIEK